MRKIIFTRPDGGKSFMVPVINTHPFPEDITEQEAEERAWKSLPEDAISPHFVEDDSEELRQLVTGTKPG